jgi:hypothetical protein
MGVYLNGVALMQRAWSWPLYRGARAQGVAVPHTMERFAELNAVTKATGNALTFQAPDAPGIAAPTAELVVKDIVAERHVGQDKIESGLTLYDSRRLLAYKVCHFDFNMTFAASIAEDGTIETKYVKDTSPSPFGVADVEWAAQKIAAQFGKRIIFKAGADYVLPERFPLSGMTCDRAMDALADEAGVDFTVDVDGNWLFVPRGAVTGEDDGLQGITESAFPWRAAEYPAFIAAENTVAFAAPREVVVPYRRRREVIVRNTTSRRTVAAQRFLRYECEQVFSFNGKWCNYAQLNDEVEALLGYPADFTEKIVAFKIMARTWYVPSPNFAEQVGGAEQAVENTRASIIQRVVDVIRRDWRRKWRLKLEREEVEGAYTDLHFGRFATEQIPELDESSTTGIDANGTIVDAAAKMPWVEFLARPLGTGQIMLGEKFFIQNPYGVAPFQATWLDRERLVFELKGIDPVEQNIGMIPGIIDPETGPQLKERVQALDNSTVGLSVIYVDAESTEFEEAFEMEVSLIGTVRHPNDARRWYTERFQSNIPSAGIDELWLEVSEELPADFSASQGDDVPVNHNRVYVHAQARARAAIERWRTKSDSTAGAHGLSLVKKLKNVTGAIRGLDIVCGAIAPHSVHCRISVGTTIDREERIARALRRDVDRSRVVHASGKAAR